MVSRIRIRWTLVATLMLSFAPIARASNAAPVHAWLSLDSEIADNLMGGITRGTRADHLLQVGLEIRGTALGLPRGGTLEGTFQYARSGHPSTSLVGDIQGFSNIAAPSRATLYTLWYAQRFDANHWTVRLGLISEDNYFDDVNSATTLINSSFGVQPTWSGDTVAPIYPIAGIGAMATWRSGAWTNRTGLFQADPTHRGSALHRGAFWMDELAYHPSAPGALICKFGLWSYRPRRLDPIRGGASVMPPATWGTYFSIEHRVLRSGPDAPVAFFRVGWSPHHTSPIPLGLQTGILIHAPLPDRPHDKLSLGIARVRIRGSGEETAYEATYVLALSRHVFLQPDLQYIAHPAGRYPSSVVFMLRVHVGFGS